MERWHKRIAVVTGASSGIGTAVVKDLVREGVIVVALARRLDRLDAIRNSLPQDQQLRFYARKCDVTVEKDVNDTFDWIEQTLGGVDILVNNAGVLIQGSLLTQELSAINQVLQTNIVGVVHCTQRAFKSMRARNFDGHVILINSLTGHNVLQHPVDEVPNFNIYGPSKYAITAINEVLRQEFRGYKTKIKISSVSPGFVDTEIVPESFQSDCMLRPEDISAGIVYALGTPPHVQVHELTIKPVGEAY
ncbi:farnesol dehydrogenase-like [Anastrepha ludens]|uniref:farnesol dehydrogenase-like n=1 Tax=Anastrepha ludens TaxID=28586 RepID=UPI0023B1797E|nr:farnesol dehydrogenase-like [Anastrepha ludens]